MSDKKRDEADEGRLLALPANLIVSPLPTAEFASQGALVPAQQLGPIMPEAAQRLWDQLGIGGRVLDRRIRDTGWGGLVPGTKTSKGESLFPRVDT